MSGLGEIVLLNAVAALLLAAAVAGCTRFVRLPAVAHVLWLLVLLRLFAPPILEVGVLPDLSEPQAATLTAFPAPLLAAPPPRTNLLRVATLTLWGAGSVLVLGLAAVRSRRFAKLVRRGQLASPELRARVRRIARSMGLRHVPPTRIVTARIPPLLWHRPGALRLLLPAGLFERLAPAEQDALIAHELAHVRRRDHWVRYLELVATAAYWWNPVVWWARHELRREEEQCCDAWVLQALAANPKDYGRALVKTLEFLAGPRVALPALACGAAGAASLKERLVMILDRRLLHVPTRLQLAALAVVAGASLLFFPTWAQREDVDSDRRERDPPRDDRARAPGNGSRSPARRRPRAPDRAAARIPGARGAGRARAAACRSRPRPGGGSSAEAEARGAGGRAGPTSRRDRDAPGGARSGCGCRSSRSSKSS